MDLVAAVIAFISVKIADQPPDKMVVLNASGFPYRTGGLAAVRGTYKYLFERREGYLAEPSLKGITDLDDEPVTQDGPSEIPLIVERIQARLHQFLK